MTCEIYAARFDLPFYLRLPTSVFLTWDPNDLTAALLPRQRLGEVAFSKTTNLIPADRLLDAPGQAPYAVPRHQVVMVCETQDYGTVPTLRIDTGLEGGCAELRPFTEMLVFVSDAVPPEQQRDRVFQVLNHFLSMYRLVTQDPWVTPVDPELDVYLVDSVTAPVPEPLRNLQPDALFQHLEAFPFATDLGAQRHHRYRLNTLEDLFPGRVIGRPFLDTLAAATRVAYEMPLHYDLLLLAQSQLKWRRYEFAVLEAETAFEVYIEELLFRAKTGLGADPHDVRMQLEDPHRLGLITQRLRALDGLGHTWLSRYGRTGWIPFIGSTLHREWKDGLYALRNRVVHRGHRGVTFEEARQGIAAAKVAIRHFENQLTELADRIQIYPGVDHLKNTAGRLRF